MQPGLDESAVFELDVRNGVGLALSVLVALISGPGGQGGGSFYIPLFSTLLGFTVNQAAALSTSVVFLGCISMVVQAVATRHPLLPGRLPVVDYALVLALTPCLMLGLALGVLLNAAISQWLLNLLVVSVWSWSCAQLCITYRRARAKGRQQQGQHAAKEAAAPAAAVAAVGKQSLGSRARQGAAKMSAWAAIQPWRIMLAIAGLFSFFILAQVLRGAVLRSCSAGYWALLGIVCGVSVVAAAAVSAWLLRQQAAFERCAVGMPALPLAAAQATDSTGGASAAGGAYGTVGALGSVVAWTPRLLCGLHSMMIVAGLLLGVWPLSLIIMAMKGMQPQVAAATSKLMLFMISAGAGLSFIASGRVSSSYLLAYGITNAVATPIGVAMADCMIRRTGRPSMLLLLTIVRLAACVVVQAAFSGVPSLIALAHGLPKAGFMANWMCR